MTTRSKGLIAAGAVAVVALVLIVVAAFNAGPTGGGPQGQSDAELAGSSTPPTSERATSVGSVGGLQDLLTKGSRAAWTRTDASGRVIMQLMCGSLDPQPDGRFALTDLELWVYLERNSLRVTAPRGQFVWPRQDEEPESGDLRGGVELALFPIDQTPDGAARKAEMIARVASLRFESAMSQIETPDPISVESTDFSFRGRGLTARISEVGRRLQYLRIGADPANRLVLTPRRSDSDAGDDRPAQVSTKTRSGSDDPASIAWYRAVFSGPVQLRQGSRSLDAAEMTGWARTVGGRLRGLDRPGPSAGDGGNATASRGGGAGSETGLDPDAPIELAWRGPLEVRAVQEAPDELGIDELAVRFLAPQDGVVRLSDRATSSWASCGTLHFAGTRRVVTLRASSRTEPARVALTGMGTLAAAQLEVGTAEWPTVALRTADGAQIEWAAQDDRALPPGTLSWTGPGEFRGVSDNGSISPRTVRLAGNIRATTQDSEGWTLGSDELSASFDSGSTTGAAQLRELLMNGSVRLEGGEGVSVASERLAISMTAGGPESEPNGRVEAAGDVRGRSPDGEIKSAGRVRFDFARRGGSTVIGDFEAEDRVYFVGGDGVEVHGDRVAGNAERKDMEATGRPAVLARFERGQQQSVSAGELRIDGTQRRFEVQGPGVLARARIDAQGSVIERMNASWSGSMHFDDVAGRGVLDGDSRCSVEQAGTERHLIAGDRLTVDVTPHQPEATDQPRRWFERALVEGSTFDAAAGGHSRVESRRYRPGPEGPVFEGLLSVESTDIQALYEGRILDLPGPGRMVIEDRRTGPREAASEAQRSSPRAVRGTTVITWAHGVRVRGAEGNAEMTGGVRVLHRPADAAEVISIECEAMRAEFSSLGGLFVPDGAPADGPASELRALHATGGVLVRQGSVQIVCDRVVFDAATDEIVALAEPGNLITVFDDKDGSQQAVEAAAMNVRTGNVRTVGRGMLTIPR